MLWLQGRKNHCVAVIGDGAITGGMAYEAMNHAGFLDKNMIVILNDNQQVWLLLLLADSPTNLDNLKDSRAAHLLATMNPAGLTKHLIFSLKVNQHVLLVFVRFNYALWWCLRHGHSVCIVKLLCCSLWPSLLLPKPRGCSSACWL